MEIKSQQKASKSVKSSNSLETLSQFEVIPSQEDLISMNFK